MNTFEEFKKSLAELGEALRAAEANGVVLSHSDSGAITDFKARQRDYYRQALLKAIIAVDLKTTKLSADLSADPSNVVICSAIRESGKKLRSATSLEQIKELRGRIAGLVVQLQAPQSIVAFTSSSIIPEIRDEVAADMEEAEKCFRAGCYRSTVVLCGRILETALHRAYYDKTGQDLLESSPGIGLGKLVAKLQEQNVFTDPSLDNQIHLINQARIFSVHKKATAFNPTAAQAQAIMLYTTDVVMKLVGKKT